jgi:hypothetical protein
LNTTPIQPQLPVSTLGILDGAGPSDSGFAEYTPLFTREGLNLQLNAIGGNNSTWGDDLILSGLRDKMSFSLGQFHYDTDGWRENSDLKHDIYNAFLQYSLAPSTNIQFEYRRQDAESGDLGLKFNPDNFSQFARYNFDRHFARIGIHHLFSPNSQLIASAYYQDLLKKKLHTETSYHIDDYPPYGDTPLIYETSDTRTKDSIARSLELQYIHSLGGHTFTIGGGYFDEDFIQTYLQTEKETYLLPESSETLLLARNVFTYEVDPSFNNFYVYSQLALHSRLTMTIGATFEDFKSSIIETKQLGPKFGLSWNALDNLALRTVYLESLARPLQFEQSIEQTQVAGFNQRYDDVQGTKIKQIGFGIDAKLGKDINIGAEITRRDLLSPLANADVEHEGRDEKLMSGYLYWTPTERLGLRIGYEKEKLERDFTYPLALRTQRSPVGINFHWTSGIYMDLEGTWIKQEFNQLGEVMQDEFWNVDTVIGYRFPIYDGKLEIIAKNLFDESFKYHDLSFYTDDILIPRIQPERQIFLRFSLNF